MKLDALTYKIGSEDPKQVVLDKIGDAADKVQILDHEFSLLQRLVASETSCFQTNPSKKKDGREKSGS